MNSTNPFKGIATLALLAVLALPCVATAAPVFRTYLSSSGNDSNSCSLAAPCRLLPAALAQTQDGGEVWMLDSANYNTGTVTINRSVTILSVPGALGSLITNDTDAIAIPTANISVTLRNLYVRAFSGLYDGVHVTGANARLVVEDSEFNGLHVAIRFEYAAGAQANVAHSRFVGNAYGMYIVGSSSASAQATAEDCTFVGAGTTFVGEGVFGLNSSIMLRHSRISNYYYAVYSYQVNSITLDDNVLAHNVVGAYINTAYGRIPTTGNNTFFANASDVLGDQLPAVANQ